MNSLNTVSNMAVSTVLKCLNIPRFEYWICMYHRELRWTGMDWYPHHYNNMLDKVVKPYFKENNQHKSKNPDAEKIEKLKHLVKLAEEWCDDQENGMTTGSICISAMKDVRRIVNA